MATLRFEPNVPQVISLMFAEGKIKPSTLPGRPDDVQFTLAQPPGATTYLPISAAEMIRRAGITAYTPFEICKVGKDDYRVRSLGAGGVGAPPVPVQPATIKSRSNHNPAASTDAPPIPWPAEPASEDRAALTPLAARFSAADMIAIDTLIAAREYAQRKGLALEIRCEDVRARAATIMIDQQKGGRS